MLIGVGVALVIFVASAVVLYCCLTRDNCCSCKKRPNAEGNTDSVAQQQGVDSNITLSTGPYTVDSGVKNQQASYDVDKGLGKDKNAVKEISF